MFARLERAPHRVAAVAAIGLATALLAGFSVASAGSAAARPVTQAKTAATSTRYAGQWGLYAPDFPGTLATVQSVEAEVGRQANYVMWYVPWAGPWSGLNTSDIASVVASGATPVITWMSYDPTGVTESAYTDAAIASGAFDSYIRTWAAGLKALRTTVYLRFDHEMNGNWYPWSPGVNGQTAAQYVAAYRHVHDIFTQVGATNVKWIWSPNVVYNGSWPLTQLYPGNSYVDYVGIDGYNWGTDDGHSWQSPSGVFGATLSQVQAITNKPILLSEVGCSPDGGNKAAWITSLFAMLESSPAIRGFIWFDADKETDWRLDDTAADLAAFAQGL